MANTVNDAFNVAEVDCVAHAALCQKHGVRGYPTVKLFEPGRAPLDYSGSRTVKAFVDFAVKSVKSVDLTGKIQKEL